MKPQEVFKKRSKVQAVQTKSKNEDGEEITVDWKVKPLSPRLMVHNYKYFAALEKLEGEEEAELSKEQEAETLEKLAPLIDVVLPFCVVDPKIVMEGETNNTQISIDDIDVETLMSLFQKIFEVSGLTDKEAEKRKNLEQSPSPKQ